MLASDDGRPTRNEHPRRPEIAFCANGGEAVEVMLAAKAHASAMQAFRLAENATANVTTASASSR